MRRALTLLVLVSVSLGGGRALGADPQPYAATLKPTGEAALDQALKDASQLVALREKAPVGPFALVTRSQEDQGRFQAALSSFGYYKARIGLTLAGRTLDDATLPDLLDVTFNVSAGPYANIGQIQVTGLKTVNEDYFRRRMLVQSGQRFSPTQIEGARQDLAALGAFSVVCIEPGQHVAPDGTIPLIVDVTERPRDAVDAGAAYSTDLGINLNAGWHHRNLFGNAEQLNLTAGVQLGGNAVHKPGYNLGIQFIKPDSLARDQALEIDLDAVKQSLDAYDQRALSTASPSAAADREAARHWRQGVAWRPGSISAPGRVRREAAPRRPSRWTSPRG